MPKSIPTEKISKNLYRTYLEKAGEFFQLMEDAENKQLWNGVGLNAVHCAISACDALTTFYLGERSRSQKHQDVVLLLDQVPLKEIKEKTRQVSSILAIKNLVEYEARGFFKEDAQKITLQTRRLYKWIKGQLP
ncbi:MAG: hypothetical protein WC901_08185 [Candidatus Margulisiibacteriota bacterium]